MGSNVRETKFTDGSVVVVGLDQPPRTVGPAYISGERTPNSTKEAPEKNQKRTLNASATHP
jgi:hypothetical protein